MGTWFRGGRTRARTALHATLLCTTVLFLSLNATATEVTAAEHPLGSLDRQTGVAQIVSAGVDDFIFDSYDAEIFLDRDAEGRSTLRTVETFVAVFPPNQNRGMLRAIPNAYKGEPVDIGGITVADETGAARAFDVETDDGFIVVTSAASSFVEGAQTYVFSYTQSNVTRFADDTNADEFYWDINGTGWGQPFGSVTATIHLGEGLGDALIAQPDCYWGVSGSTETCEIVDAGGDSFVASHGPAAPGENMTVAFGFAPGTFVARDKSYFGSAAGYGQSAGLVVAIGALMWAVSTRRRKLADAAGRPTIIAEYAPPGSVSILTSALIIKERERAIAALILDFAVRGNLRLLEVETRGFLRSRTDYNLELLDSRDVGDNELDVLRALFGQSLQHGAIRELKAQDATLSQRLYKLLRRESSGLVKAGYRRKLVAKNYLPLALVPIGLGLSVFFGVALIGGFHGGVTPLLVLFAAALSGLFASVLLVRHPLSEKGAELRDHLKGLELYIRLAEADRLKMLQSPTGALREENSSTGEVNVLKVYEKLLPYAVLFGLEEMWSTELSRHYAESSPDWYHGTAAFSGAAFATSISDVSSSIASSYSGSASSSSSGGSGGGGSSGGGGGGGGGGGV